MLSPWAANDCSFCSFAVLLKSSGTLSELSHWSSKRSFPQHFHSLLFSHTCSIIISQNLKTRSRSSVTRITRLRNFVGAAPHHFFFLQRQRWILNIRAFQPAHLFINLFYRRSPSQVPIMTRNTTTIPFPSFTPSPR